MNRFWEKVVKTEPEACWLWNGYTQFGYGRHCYGPAKQRIKVQAHRFAYQQIIGEIEGGKVLDHLCGTTNCVNPAHLEAVTQRVNLSRSRNMVARYMTTEHCKRGHRFDEANTRITKTGGRVCRACMRLWFHENKERLRGRNSQTLTATT